MHRLELSQRLQTIRRISRILWVRVALILALAVLAALSAELLDPLIPRGPKDRFTANATLPILNVLANGMLAVATFSLGVMVSSHRTMSEQTTPRIHRLLMEDASTQSVLATFIGAFVFSLAAIILFRAGYYSDSAAVIVFAATVLVVIAIVVSLVRWIHQLTRIGSVDYALERAEDAARTTLENARKAPALGGRILDRVEEIPEYATGVKAPKSGYLLRIDLDALQEAAAEAGGEVYIVVLPGDRILEGQEIARTVGHIEASEVENCFVFASNRSYEQDPRYALQAMRETASKALSPGINDPGTAIEVVARLERLLWDGLQISPSDDLPVFDRLHIRQLSDDTLLDLAFRDIGRDGSAILDVLLAISETLTTLGDQCDSSARETLKELHDALDQHAEVGLATEIERETYRRVTSARQIAA